jgi:hypothetical protein
VKTAQNSQRSKASNAVLLTKSHAVTGGSEVLPRPCGLQFGDGYYDASFFRFYFYITSNNKHDGFSSRHELSPQSRCLENLIVTHLAKKLPTFYRPQNFGTVFERYLYWTLF